MLLNPPAIVLLAICLSTISAKRCKNTPASDAAPEAAPEALSAVESGANDISSPPQVDKTVQQPSPDQAPTAKAPTAKAPPATTPSATGGNTAVTAGSNSKFPAGIPDSATDQIRKDAKFKNLAVLGTDATARLDNTWMASCKSGYAFCAWSVPNGANSNDCSTGAKIHAHGVVIKGTPGTKEFFNSQLAMNYVQLYDHYERRNYFKLLPGAKHACDCGENMPIVRRSDASEMKATPKGRTMTLEGVTFPDPSDPGNFQAAGGNDLATAYKKANNGQAVPGGNLAGKCAKK